MSDDMLGRIVQKLVKLPTEMLGTLYDLLERLTSSDSRKWFLKLKKFLRGEVVFKYIVDLDADPKTPFAGWRVVEHVKGGKFEFDPKKVKLYFTDAPGDGRGHALREMMKDQPVYNANLLDFYLENTHLIPADWHNMHVCFWGTIYTDDQGRLCIRTLWMQRGAGAIDIDETLDSIFLVTFPAAIVCQ